MKLIYCPKCQDVRKLDFAVTVCNCGASKGWYANDALNAIIQGEAVLLGFDNPSLMAALHNQPEDGTGEVFTAFVIPKDCPTVTKLEGRRVVARPPALGPVTHYTNDWESHRLT